MPTDYIIRTIEQIATALSGIIAKQHGGQYAEARAELDKKCLETIGLHINELGRLSPEAIANALNSSGAFRHPRALILAELLLHDASMGDADGNNPRAPMDYLHAFCLLTDSIQILDIEDQKVYRSKIEALAVRLGELRAHPYIDQKLRRYEQSKDA